MNQQDRKKKGFTLVEITIVTAVVGILTAISVPMIQRHIMQAKEQTLLQSLHKLQLQFEYAYQSIGRYPNANEIGNVSGSSISVPASLGGQGGGSSSGASSNESVGEVAQIIEKLYSGGYGIADVVLFQNSVYDYRITAYGDGKNYIVTPTGLETQNSADESEDGGGGGGLPSKLL